MRIRRRKRPDSKRFIRIIHPEEPEVIYTVGLRKRNYSHTVNRRAYR